MKRILIIFLCLFTAALLFACAEQEIAKQESSTISHSVPTEPSALPTISDISLLEESLSEPVSEASEATSPEEISSNSAVPSLPPDNSEQVSTTQSQPEVLNPTPHMVNGFLVCGNRGMELFGGTASSGAETAKLMNSFKEKVGNAVNVYAMPIPLACAFYAPEGYESSIVKTADCFTGLRDALVDVQFVDLLSALSPHTQEEIYARTDHHWFALGAYYAAEALCRQAGADFAPLSQFDQYSFDGFLGSVYKTYDVSELGSYPETFVWYEPKQTYTAHYYSQSYRFSFSGSMFSSSQSYIKFIYGDSYAVRVETGVQNGRKMLIIKDSFGNALAPFLIAGFEEVYVVDLREFSCNILDFIEENQITDVTFALSAFSVAGTKRNYITTLMTQ